ncbi:DUF4097 family beta strand repeat-containing protein [Paenibacillus sp. PL2-23]|uniref:DUF4097 family beta strand repeat-containing protein n=1 Tax=Paenibacillus sp. PL2-23 TaxID=2100729 RepID=UPI0030F5400A
MKPKSLLGVTFVVIGLIGLYYVFANEGKLPLAGLHSVIGSEIQEQKKVELDGIRHIEFESNSIDANFVRGASEQAVFMLEGRATKSVMDNLTFDFTQDGDTLEVTLKRNNPFGFNWSSLKLTVALPEQQWGDLSIRLRSGDLQLEDQLFDNVNIASHSGDFEAERLTVAGELSIDINSGDIFVKDFTAELVTFDVSSGDVHLKDGTAAYKGSTSSGDITIEVEELLYDSELEASSGDITVKLDRDPESLAVQFRAGSGDGVISKKGFTYDRGAQGERHIEGAFGNGDVLLQAETGSGDFVLR